jgi:hypothetical protein
LKIKISEYKDMTTEELTKAAEDYADQCEIRGSQFWENIIHGYKAGYRAAEYQASLSRMVGDRKVKPVPYKAILDPHRNRSFGHGGDDEIPDFED